MKKTKCLPKGGPNTPLRLWDRQGGGRRGEQIKGRKGEVEGREVGEKMQGENRSNTERRNSAIEKTIEKLKYREEGDAVQDYMYAEASITCQ